MIAFYVTVLVLVSDQAVKLLLRRARDSYTVSLGPFGAVRLVSGRLWLRQMSLNVGILEIWCVWTAAAVPLLVVSALLPSTATFAGLLLGGSLSQGLESSIYGKVSDYICLRFWPAFNLADVALAAGAIGLFGEALIMARATMF